MLQRVDRGGRDHAGLAHAARSEQFSLVFQPMMSVSHSRPHGAEAFIRWQHPQRGLLLPDVFLPVIDDHPLAVDIGEWVIDSALAPITRHSMPMIWPGNEWVTKNSEPMASSSAPAV